MSESRALWHMFTGMNRWKRDSQADRIEEGKHVTWD